MSTTTPVERRIIATGAYLLTALMLLCIVVLLPLALRSVWNDVGEQSQPRFRIATPETTGEAVRSYVHLDLISLNEWENTVTVRATIHQSCDRACPWGDRYLFFSVRGDAPDDALLQPSSESVTLPATGQDVTQIFKLPLYGDPIRYPFDRYQLVLGVTLDRLAPDGSVRTLSAAEARAYASVTLQARTPRSSMERPVSLDPATLQGIDPEPYLTAQQLTFVRPVYLKVLTVLLVVLVTAAAIYAVFLRPLDQLIINSGALILGVWGVRSILVGTGLPGLTMVDLTLAVVILFLLFTIALRTLWLLEDQSSVQMARRFKRRTSVMAVPAASDRLPDYVEGAPAFASPNGAASPADTARV